MAVSEQLIAQTTRHGVYLERLKSGEVNQFAAFLKMLDKDLRDRLTGRELTEFSRARVERLLAENAKALAAIFDQHYDELAGHLIELAEYESGFEARNLDSVLTQAPAVVPTANQVRTAVLTAPLSVSGVSGGQLLEPFIRDLKTTEIKRINGAIRLGYSQGQSNAEIIRRLRGTKANKYRDGLLAVTQRSAAAIVRTSVQHVANTARMETWKENSNIVTGYRWVSTLDSRTSQTCASLDGQAFKTGKGPMPPAHINCRSGTVATLDDRYAFLDKDATRAARGPEGAGKTDATETYYSWLKRQPAEFQRDAIGPKRAKLLRDGGLSAERFAELNLGRNFEPLTLAEMRRIEPTAFIRSGLDG